LSIQDFDAAVNLFVAYFCHEPAGPDLRLDSALETLDQSVFPSSICGFGFAGAASDQLGEGTEKEAKRTAFLSIDSSLSLGLEAELSCIAGFVLFRGCGLARLGKNTRIDTY
jgi:hypothetical protein